MKLNGVICISFLILLLTWACDEPKEQEQLSGTGENWFELIHDTLINLTELQPCDILVKPNLNWIPGTSMVQGGRGFGHAVIVVEGAKGVDAMDVLRKAKVFESQARVVTPSYQLRLVNGYLEGSDFRFANINFEPKHQGFRYRLRLPLSQSQKDSVLKFVLDQDPDVSNWRSMKRVRPEADTLASLTPEDKQTWYCSLLIWQAFYSALDIDLDENGGWMVFPNDLIASPYFNNDQKNKEKRVRF